MPFYLFYNFMEANSKANLCGGNIYKKNMTPTSSCCDIDFLTLEDVNVIVGADLFILRSLFEEVELCDRIRKAGYNITSVPEAEIIHLQGGSTENKNEELNK